MKKHITLISVVIFYIIAVACRYSYHIYIDTIQGTNVSFEIFRLLALLSGVGPTLAALFCIYILRRPVICTPFGISTAKSILSWAVPVAVAAIYDLFSTSPTFFSIDILMLLAYGFLEEYGWRGYLQHELSNFRLPFWAIAIIIGLLHAFWHLHAGSPMFYVAIIAASFGIGYLALITRSIFICACFHITWNFFSFSYIQRNPITITIFTLFIIYWVLLWFGKDIFGKKHTSDSL